MRENAPIGVWHRLPAAHTGPNNSCSKRKRYQTLLYKRSFNPPRATPQKSKPTITTYEVSDPTRESPTTTRAELNSL